MTDLDTEQSPLVARLAEVAGLLGAPHTLRKVPRNPLEAHEMLLRGLPTKALTHLVQNLVLLRWDESFARAVGMSHVHTNGTPLRARSSSIRSKAGEPGSWPKS